MNYGYLALVIPGLFAASAGFVMLGGRRFHGTVAGLVFLAGFIALIMGILLTCVPDFFS